MIKAPLIILAWLWRLVRLLWTAEPPAPYVLALFDGADDLFTLRARPLLAPASREEQLLAEAITDRVRGFQYLRLAALGANPPPRSSTPDLRYQFIEALRDIAVHGLTATRGRDFVRQRRVFRDLFASVAPLAAPASVAGGDGAFTVSRDPDGQIVIQRNHNGQKPTDPQTAFAAALAKSERLVEQLYTRAFHRRPDEARDKIDDMQKRLQWAGQIALVGCDFDVPLATIALTSIEDDAIQDCGTKVRSRYLRDLALHYAGFAVLAVALLVGYHWLTKWLFPELLDIQITTGRLVYVGIATIAMLFGAWLSAANRVQPSDPVVLRNLISETLSYWVRAAFVIGFGWFALLLLHEQVLRLDFGGAVSDATGFKTHLALTNLAAAILTGGFLGLAERAVPTGILQRADTLAGALATK